MLISAAHVLGAAASQEQGKFLLMLCAYAGIFAVFYFLIIRPSRTRQKEHAQLLEALKPGDKVVCLGGLHATVVGLSESTVQVRIADQVRVDVEKSSITTVKRSD